MTVSSLALVLAGHTPAGHEWSSGPGEDHTWSSDTKPPDFIVFSSCFASSEPLATSALSKSPVLKCLR